MTNLTVAIVGSGPAGLYAAEHLLKHRNLNVNIDVYERLPTPWGLVRNGVAPDHPEKKRVSDTLFKYQLGHPRVRFFGNIHIGIDVQPSELNDWYDAVIYATGADGDVRMNIPGESLDGSVAAREFVAWYNGHPDFSDAQFDLSHQRAVIVGNGNVALDIARILTTDKDALSQTDIADHALKALRRSRINEVVILGRRGAAQAAFNNPELDELAHLEQVAITIEGDDLDSTSDESLSWETRRKLATLARLQQPGFQVDGRSTRADSPQITIQPTAKSTAQSAVQSTAPSKRIVFKFLASPVAIFGDTAVTGLTTVRNRLSEQGDGSFNAEPTNHIETLEAGLVLRAIGYRGTEQATLPFDDDRGVIKNYRGRVDGLQGVYVTGWIKRGPRGVIGTNKKCAAETVDRLLEDLDGGQLTGGSKGSEAIYQTLKQRQPDLVSWQDWQKIDRAERIEGTKTDRPRVKLTTHQALLNAAQA